MGEEGFGGEGVKYLMSLGRFGSRYIGNLRLLMETELGRSLASTEAIWSDEMRRNRALGMLLTDEEVMRVVWKEVIPKGARMGAMS